MVVLTTCTASKSSRPGTIPAQERYQGPRIEQAQALAATHRCPLLFLSGVYGLVPAEAPLPWYDHALQPDEVDRMVLHVTAQLKTHQITRITALMQPADRPGWLPYHHLLQRACQRGQVHLNVLLTDQS